jgi:phage terminase large subunit
MSNPDQRVFVIRGGQGASKTVSILELIIQSLVSSPKEATILSSELSKMKRTVMRDYKKICKDWGVINNDAEFNRSDSKHEYPNDSYLDFLGADVTDIGKGFRRDILYINEADKMDLDTAVQFISRAGITIIDYNPDRLFWGDDYINDHNFITLTFEDNEHIPKSERESILDYKTRGFYNPDLPFDELFEESNIKSSYWANKWKVYGLGLVGSLDGVVFDNWKQVDAIPAAATLLAYGMDFGYTNDPTTLTGIYEYDNEYYFDEMLYQTGLTNNDIANLCKGMNLSKAHHIYADSAEPKSIEELKRAGLKMIPAEKGNDSINFGINKMQEKPFHVTKRSVNLMNELAKYTWAKDKTGVTLNKPIDAHNHGIDGIRYYFTTGKKYTGQYYTANV